MPKLLSSMEINEAGTDTLEIVLPCRRVALIDKVDRAYVEDYHWHALVGPKTAYVVRNVKKADGHWLGLLMHRVITDAQPGQVVDHKNRNGLDNRRNNLRVCTQAKNNGNAIRPSHNVSGYKGVSWHASHNKWRAVISFNNRQRHLGYFEDRWDAAQAYNAAAVEQFGEFALLNERLP